MKHLFFSLIFGFFLLPLILIGQTTNKTLMHHEVIDDPYIPGTNDNTVTSPAYKFKSSVFYTTQVNINADGENIIGDAGNEPSIAVDPVNPNRMAIGWRQFDNVNNNFRQAGYGYTTDGGETWTFPGVIEPGVFRSDPVLDFDAEGNFYYNSLTKDDFNNYTCQVFKIEDGGAEWDAGTYAQGGDKQWMRIDKTDGVGSGNNYSFWTSDFSICQPGAFTRSTDYGSSYEECTVVDGDPSWGTLAVGPDGELYIVGRGDEYDIVVTKSTTAQNPAFPVFWDLTTPIDLDGELTGWTNVNPEGLLGQAWIDVDVSDGPGRGNVYVLASVDRNSNNDHGDVMFAKSTDGGLTWSAPMRINDDPTINEIQWFGTMSVAPNGRIDAVWLDTREAPGNSYNSALYYSYSLDQGDTWTENEKLSNLFDPHVGWPNQEKMGDYFDMVSDNESAHLAWANTLNGEQDVYYGRITPQIVGISDKQEQAVHFSLTSYPNPFKGNTTIRYNLPANDNVSLGIYDVFGKEVKNLLNEAQQAGLHNLTFNADNLTEGIYFCRIQSGEFMETIRLVVME
jgi:hypothetical protein